MGCLCGGNGVAGTSTGGSWIWILILLFCCGGCGGSNGIGGIFGGNGCGCGNDSDCSWIIILILLLCCCGGCGGNVCGNNCGMCEA